MITPRLVGPRGILCLSGLLAVSILSMGARSVTEFDAAEPAKWLQVRMKETPCSIETCSAPVLERVRSVLSTRLAGVAKGESTIDGLWDGLDLAFGTDATQTAALIEYVWVNIDGQWVRMCIVTARFEIAFGSEGTVVVSCRDTRPTT